MKSSLRQLFDKLGVRTRAQLVRIALEQYRDQLSVRNGVYFPAGAFNVTTGDGNLDPTGPVNSSFVPSS
jgi:hypothetical protein